jgi:hypothetical protein
MIMANKGETSLIKQITQNYGSVIDLEETPSVLTEIFRIYGKAFTKAAGAVDGMFQVAGTGTIAVNATIITGSVKAPGSIEQVELRDIMQAILNMSRQISTISQQLNTLTSSPLVPLAKAQTQKSKSKRKKA